MRAVSTRRTPIRETRGVLAVVTGNWAAHPRATTTSTDSRTWTVSYVPSGRCLMEVACGPAKAIRIAKALRAEVAYLDVAERPTDDESRAIEWAVNRASRGEL